MRYAMWLGLAWVLAGCVRADAVLTDPKTGASVTCGGTWRELDPWSNADACIGQHEAQGWAVTSGR